MQPAQVVIFGASGDLTLHKLMPALASLASKQRDGSSSFSVVGVSRSPKSDDDYRREVAEHIPPELKDAFASLAPRVSYVQADVLTPADMTRLAARLDQLQSGEGEGRLYYLSLKPDLFAPTTAALKAAGMLEQGPGQPFRRVIVEKPFGHDHESARALDQALYASLREDQIFRIDHYLGKETVQNLLGFRFHNAIFEPIWNRHHVEHIQITVAEQLGMESGRAGYYDSTGATRDMLQNHMMQVLALVAMEPPTSLDVRALRSQKVNLLRSLRVPGPASALRNSVRARYTAGQIGDKPVPGYLDEDGVAADSTTETYVAIRAEIDSWRWAGVPILLRHGKRMPQKFTEVRVQFRVPPLQLFNRPQGLSDDEFRDKLADGSLCQMRPNVLTLTIQPREAIRLSFGVKTPGPAMIMAPAELSFDYREHFGATTAPAYERLLQDALQGDATLFVHADEIAACWRFVDAYRAAWDSPDAPPIAEYVAGSWGPEAADELFHGCEGGWSQGQV